MIIDLHVHSHYSSDGKLTISELLDLLAKDTAAKQVEGMNAGYQGAMTTLSASERTPSVGVTTGAMAVFVSQYQKLFDTVRSISVMNNDVTVKPYPKGAE